MDQVQADPALFWKVNLRNGGVRTILADEYTVTEWGDVVFYFCEAPSVTLARGLWETIVQDDSPTAR